MENLPVLAKDASMFFDIAKFEHSQRVAKVFAESTMVPDHFKGNIGNTLIAMNFADRIGADIFMVMQSLYVINGKPGIEGKLVLALVNNCGRFEPLEFEEVGDLTKHTKDSDGCVACAKDIKSGKILKGPKIDWKMVKGEGWLGKKGSKWQTIAPLMFRYRAATYFARTYCPEVLLGMQTREELNDVINVTPNELGTYEESDGTAAYVNVDDALTDRDTSLYTGINGGDPAPKKVGATETEPDPATSENTSNPDTPGMVEPRTYAERNPNSGGNSRPREDTPPPVSENDFPDGTQEDKEIAESLNAKPADWDPREHDLMARYHPDKKEAVLKAAGEMGIRTDGRMPREVHADILAASQEPQEQEDPPADPPVNKSTREQFFDACHDAGFEDEDKIKACLAHHEKKTGLDPRSIMTAWLNDFHKFKAMFVNWQKPVSVNDGPTPEDTEERMALIEKCNRLRAHDHAKFEDVRTKLGIVQQNPNGISDVGLQRIIDAYEEQARGADGPF